MTRMMRQRKASSQGTATVRQRAREAGVGLADMTAPAAHREVEIPPEVETAAQELYREIKQANQPRRPPEGGPGDQEQARNLAAAEGRRLIIVDG